MACSLHYCYSSNYTSHKPSITCLWTCFQNKSNVFHYTPVSRPPDSEVARTSAKRSAKNARAKWNHRLACILKQRICAHAHKLHLCAYVIVRRKRIKSIEDEHLLGPNSLSPQHGSECFFGQEHVFTKHIEALWFESGAKICLRFWKKSNNLHPIHLTLCSDSNTYNHQW